MFNVFQIQTPPEERRNKTRMYNAMTIAGLQQWTDQVHATHPYSYVCYYISNELYILFY